MRPAQHAGVWLEYYQCFPLQQVLVMERGVQLGASEGADAPDTSLVRCARFSWCRPTNDSYDPKNMVKHHVNTLGERGGK